MTLRVTHLELVSQIYPLLSNHLNGSVTEATNGHISAQHTVLMKLTVMSSVITMGTSWRWKHNRILPTSCFLSDRVGQKRERSSKMIPVSLLPQTYFIEDAFTTTC